MSAVSQSLSAAVAFVCLLIAAHFFWRGNASVRCILLATFFFLFGLQLALLAFYVPTEIATLVYIRALLALIIVPNGYLMIASLREKLFRFRHFDLIHALPACIGMIAVATRRTDGLDFVVPGTAFVYALATAWFVPHGEAQFAGLKPFRKVAYIWLIALTGLYFAMGLIDSNIAVELAKGGAIEDSQVLAAGLLVLSFFVGYILLGALAEPAFLAGLDSGVAVPRYARSTLDPDERAHVARRVQAMLDDTTILHDEGMTVARLARRMTLPARHVTEAVNMELDRSFSELLNERRIEAAKGFLRSADHASKSVLEIAHMVGYASKSNFNREFLRRTGETPSAYRQSAYAKGTNKPLDSSQIARPQS